MSIELAMMMCVRDEERFLDANLRYHHRLGVERAYLFLDRCTDSSEAIARSFPWVVVFTPARQASEPILAYQNRCAAVALELARLDDVRWLLHLDPDEFAFGENGDDDPVADGSLRSLVRRARPGTDQVTLRAREVIPVRLDPGASFLHQVYFQDGHVIERDLLDPSTRTVRRLQTFLGHRLLGKSIVRVSAPVRPKSSHGWMALEPGAKLKTERHGFHYHYIVTSSVHWREKYMKFVYKPATGKSVKLAPFPKQAFKEASLVMTPAEADRYYQEWVALDVVQADSYVHEGLAVKDDRVRRILEASSDALDALPSPRQDDVDTTSSSAGPAGSATR